jgi:hypothetical protein
MLAVAPGRAMKGSHAFYPLGSSRGESAVMRAHRKQQYDRNRYAQQPKEHTTPKAHDQLSFPAESVTATSRVRSQRAAQPGVPVRARKVSPLVRLEANI